MILVWHALAGNVTLNYWNNGFQKTAMAQREIVVVGASAGGVEALQTLINGLPASMAASVFVVLHIPSDAASNLHEVLGLNSALPVEPAQDGAPIVPGRVYVGVPDRHLLIESNRIRVTRGPKENRARPAVDALFRSAAYHYGSKTIGVVLSGNLDDGTAGLWTIKDRGGVALVQSLDDAFYPSMPKSAIEHVAVDHVLPVAEMPSVITSLTKETIPAVPLEPKVTTMETEISIAVGENPLLNGSLKLGPISPNTCPTCHGVLVRINEGKIIRYRCHTGHAFSMQSLFTQLGEEIDITLMTALRTIDERIFLLQQMEQLARDGQDVRRAIDYTQQIKVSKQWLRQLLEMIASSGNDVTSMRDVY